MFVLKVETIEALRGERGLTLQALADKSGKHVSALSKLLPEGAAIPPRLTGWRKRWA